MQSNFNVNPIVNELYTDSEGNRFSKSIDNEEQTVNGNKIILSGLPDKGFRMKITNGSNTMVEIPLREQIVDENQFKVDYSNGSIYFDNSLDGTSVLISYHSRGLAYFPASRIYVELDEWGKVKKTLEGLEGEIHSLNNISEQLPSMIETMKNAENNLATIYNNATEKIKDFNELSTETISQIDTAINSAQETLNNLRVDIQSAEELETSLTTIQEQTTILYENIKVENEKIEKNILSSSNNILELSNLTIEAKSITDTLKEAVESSSGYEQVLGELLTNLNKGIETATSQISILEGIASQSENLSTDLGQKNTSATQNISDLENSIQQSQQERVKLEQFITTSQQTAQEIYANLIANEERFTRLEESLNTLSERAENVENNLEELLKTVDLDIYARQENLDSRVQLIEVSVYENMKASKELKDNITYMVYVE